MIKREGYVKVSFFAPLFVLLLFKEYEGIIVKESKGVV